MRILVVEDEGKICRFIAKGLEAEGFVVDTCSRGDEALLQLLTTPYDAAILDIMLPGPDGISVLKAVREKGVHLPILLLSARSQTRDKIEGLNSGADDYLPKPFSMDELVARLRALIRRTAGVGLSVYKVGNLTLNLVTREVFRGQKKIDLTAKEFSLLELLMRTPGRVFTRTQICEHVWNYHFDPGTNLVDVYIQKLRKKIDEFEEQKLIQTVRGVGYKIEAV
ncbi:DNA-binding response regulator [Candidatus Methylacidiphilum fumarolicum]|uniref:DNA binding copper response regulator n=2 Tax=Candidatus Methylacidiphilum fumarolicum TaxID=591154 RepID=I0JZQ4_METFB|nr:response regulator transcription factor [Candidatus Methylacidiphilum fumarolicum]MBW6415859.1 response regulator transcription factor [Candidatus Methylacidiphilum fumarolicum]TFE67678.1 DNA-binding response regulator [Candidatus Methylacidiphilum fumarolicum]TFE72427.1 DNA-binding response regulator [Candidatus Methylacidiphilum fumarolicum]TFE72445.1 DNA-binding response regulator [Candidatus Methylacidiphilum fumarolicum]TFE77802.1 DNA-binding response regulator [Candidatus Methylacidip